MEAQDNINLAEAETVFRLALVKLRDQLIETSKSQGGGSIYPIERLIVKLTTAELAVIQKVIDACQTYPDDMPLGSVPGLKDAVERLRVICKEVESYLS